MARKTPGLNTSSMADISFLLLAFFLMVSDIKADKGLIRVLPPIPKEKAERQEIHQRNIFTVLVNEKDQIITTDIYTGGLDSKPITIDQLKSRAKRFLNSMRPDDPNLPEMETISIEGASDGPKTYRVSKGVISLQCHFGTSYEKYFQVQNELTAAVTELRNEFSAKEFGRKNYMDLPNNRDNNLRKVVEKAVPMAISEAKPSNIGGNN